MARHRKNRGMNIPQMPFAVLRGGIVMSVHKEKAEAERQAKWVIPFYNREYSACEGHVVKREGKKVIREADQAA